MPVTLHCPRCRTTITARQSPTGKPIICPNCDRKFTPPTDDDDPDDLVDRSPRSRKTRENDDELEYPRDRKARRGKRKKKRGSPLRFILPLGGLTLLLALGLVLYLFVIRPFVKDRGGSGDQGSAAQDLPEAEMLAWAPADSADVSFVNHKALAYMRTQRGNPYERTVFVPGGLDPNEFDAAMLAGRAGRFDTVYVLRLKNPNAEGIDQAMTRLGGRPKQVGNQTVHQAQRYAMYRASDRILVVSDRRDYIEERIRSNPRRLEISGSVLDLVSRASADAWDAHVAVGIYKINGFQVQSSLTMLQVREDGALFTSDITYSSTEIATQAAAAERAKAAIEIQQNGPRVVYRRGGGTAAAGVGIGGVIWRW